ncbi:hypothetical protein K8I28_08585 [bacterium]|nr:hypothetical protein [bacterium]
MSVATRTIGMSRSKQKSKSINSLISTILNWFGKELLVVIGICAIIFSAVQVYTSVQIFNFGRDVRSLEHKKEMLQGDVYGLVNQKSAIVADLSIQDLAAKMGMVSPEKKAKVLHVSIPEKDIPPTWRRDSSLLIPIE